MLDRLVRHTSLTRITWSTTDAIRGYWLSDGNGEYEIGLQVTAPSGKAVNMKLPPVQLADPRAKARAVIRLNGMPFEEFGTYAFRLILDGAPIEWPCHYLEHSQIQAPTNGPASGSMPPPPGSFSN